jgi:predicted transcriptional regulator
MEVMNLEVRKLNLINWISSIQEEEILSEVEKVQKEKADWWDKVNHKDKKAIKEGLDQLDRGEFITRDEARNKIKERFNL